MRPGLYVIRVSGAFSGKEVGDIDKIRKIKIHNNCVVLNFESQKLETWHSQFNYRLISDVNVPMLRKNLAHVAEKMKESIAKRKNTLKESE